MLQYNFSLLFILYEFIFCTPYSHFSKINFFVLYINDILVIKIYFLILTVFNLMMFNNTFCFYVTHYNRHDVNVLNVLVFICIKKKKRSFIIISLCYIVYSLIIYKKKNFIINTLTQTYNCTSVIFGFPKIVNHFSYFDTLYLYQMR